MLDRAAVSRLHLRNLDLYCIIGTMPRERVVRRKVIVNIALECDIARAARSDNLADAINYKTLAEQIARLAQKNKFHLIETLADRIADLCLRNRKVSGVRVVVDKPDPLLMPLKSAAVEIYRQRARR